MDCRSVIKNLEERPALICVASIFLAMLAIRAPFIFYIGMSTDAYNNGSALPPYEFLAGQGRHGAYVLMKLMSGLGIYGPYFQPLNVLLGISALSAAAFYLFRSVLGNAWALILIGSLLFLSHPYQAEIFTFRDAVPFYATATLLGCTGYYIAGQGTRKSVAIGLLLIVAGLTIYQSFLNFLAIAWLLQLLLAVVAPRSGTTTTAQRRKLAIQLATVAISVLAYMMATKLLNLALGTAATGRATFITWEEAPKRVIEVLGVIKQFLHVDLISPAPLTSLLIAGLVLATSFVILLKGSSTWRFALVPAIGILTLISSVGIISVGRDFWPMPRTLVAIALIPAFAACIIPLIITSPIANRLVTASSAIILISFMGIGNLVATEQVRMNKRDALFAASLVARIPLTPGTHLAIIGGPNNAFGLSTVRGDMNISAYWPLWSKTKAISEFIGYPVLPPDEQELTRSQEYCASPLAGSWPATNSSAELDDGLVVVCLSRP